MNFCTPRNSLRIAIAASHISGFAMAFFLTVQAHAAVMYGIFTNSVGQPDTNVVRIIPVSGPVANADGSFTSIGLPIRVTPAADGHWTNVLAENNYVVTNQYLGQGIAFRAPLDNGNTPYNVWDRRISGFNYFVTIQYGSNPAPTFNTLTNVLGSWYATSNGLWVGSNALQIQISSATNSGITAATATNISAYQAKIATNGLALITYVDTRINNASNAIIVAPNFKGPLSVDYPANNDANVLFVEEQAGYVFNGDVWSPAFHGYGGYLTGLPASSVTNLGTLAYSNAPAYGLLVTNAAAYQAMLATNSLSGVLVTRITDATNDLNTTLAARLIATNALLVTRITAATNVVSVDLGTRIVITNNLLKAYTDQATNVLFAYLIAYDNAGTNALNNQLRANITNNGNTKQIGSAVLTNLSITGAITNVVAGSNATVQIANGIATVNAIPSGGTISNAFWGTNATTGAITNQGTYIKLTGNIDAGIKQITNLSRLKFTNLAIDREGANNTGYDSTALQLFGGTSNTVSGTAATTDDVLLGGRANTFNVGALLGGQVVVGNQMLGGSSNTIQGSLLATFRNSTILGGQYNLLDGATASLIAGSDVKISHDGVFGFGDASGDGQMASVTNHSAFFRLRNGMGINTNFAGTNTLRVAGNIDTKALSLADNPFLTTTTNNLAVSGAGQAAVNGTFYWQGNRFTNAQTSCFLTNNNGVWQFKTNVATVLYSLTQTSPQGTYTVQAGPSGAPTAIFGNYQELAGSVWHGPINSTNLEARLAAASTNTAIARDAGSGTNTTIYTNLTISGNATTTFQPTNIAQFTTYLSTNSWAITGAGTTTANQTYYLFSRPNGGIDIKATNANNAVYIYYSDDEAVWAITNGTTRLYHNDSDLIYSNWSTDSGTAPAPTGYIPTNSIGITNSQLAVIGAPLKVFATNTTVYVDSISGDDTTGMIGDPTRPFGTLDAAYYVATFIPTNAIIQLGAGFYPITNSLDLVRGMKMKGAGKYVSTITSTATTATYIFKLNDYSVMSDLGFVTGVSSGNTFQVPIWGYGDNWRCINLYINGYTDCFYFISRCPTGGVIDNCDGFSRWDTFADFNNGTAAGGIVVKNTRLVAEYSANNWTTFSGLHGIVLGSTSNYWVNSSITVINGYSNACIYVPTGLTSGHITLDNTTLSNTGTNAETFAVKNIGGSQIAWRSVAGTYYGDGSGLTNLPSSTSSAVTNLDTRALTFNGATLTQSNNGVKTIISSNSIYTSQINDPNSATYLQLGTTTATLYGLNQLTLSGAAIALSGPATASSDVIVTANGLTSTIRSNSVTTLNTTNTGTAAFQGSGVETTIRSNTITTGNSTNSGNIQTATLYTTGIADLTRLIVDADGSASLAAIGRGRSGMYFSGTNGEIYVTVGGTYQGSFKSGTASWLQAGKVGFESGGAASSLDTFFTRAAAGTFGFNGVVAATNGFVSYATNYFPNVNTAGYTNSATLPGFGGTNQMQARVTATSGTIEFYTRSATSGQTICGQGVWTNTLGALALPPFHVGVNQGFVIRSPVGVDIQVYAE